MFVSVPVFRHASREMARKERASKLRELVADVARQEAYARGDGVESALDREQRRHPAGSEIVDREKRVLAVFFRDVVGDAVKIFALYRHVGEFGEDAAPDGRELGRIVRADVEGRRLLVGGKRVEPDREGHHLAGTAGSFEQPLRIRVEPRRRIGVDVAHPARIVVIRCGAVRIVLDVGVA